MRENPQDNYPLEVEQIMKTGFYLFEDDGRFWMAVMTPNGMIGYPLDPAEWIDWLRTQLARCKTSNLPLSIGKEFSEYV